jgi:hypothetical protein
VEKLKDRYTDKYGAGAEVQAVLVLSAFVEIIPQLIDAVFNAGDKARNPRLGDGLSGRPVRGEPAGCETDA